MCVLGAELQRAGGAESNSGPTVLGHSRSFLVVLSSCSPVCFRGPLMWLGYSQHPAQLQGFGSSKAIFLHPDLTQEQLLG